MTGTKTMNGTSQPPQSRWKWNALFRGDQKASSYNACVGNNGNPDIYYYADGYADSVNLLIDGLTKRQGTLDTLIYPICFSLRHYVELTIKGQIQELSWLAKVCKRPLAPDNDVAKVLNQHDIKNLWDYFSRHAIAIDRRYQVPISGSEALISCIAETDPTGQTFRYSYSTEAKKHLTDVSLINVLVLRDQFKVIRGNLEKLRELTGWLMREYQTGTFTKSLNREDLMAIAKQLPPRQLWADKSSGFDEIKSSVKSAYSIGSAELTEAIRKIEASRDMMRLIGGKVSVPGLSFEDLIALNDCWKLAWNRDALESELRDDIYGRYDTSIRPVDLLQVARSEMQVEKNLQASFNRFMKWATEEKLAGLRALLDGGDYYFPEEYDSYYEYCRKEMVAFFSASAVRNEEIDDIWAHTVGRPDYPSKIIHRLKYVGFTDEANNLAENLFS